ncbi:MAG TPA: GTP-dependent dephospho-CoA kinase family protein [Methanoregulaceae archaeon]|nr:GTP-dependent dephospho-CoA kinase family protein [Methanoregulaceae archaeon]
MLYLPDEKRKYFKAPFGTLYRDISDVLPLIRGSLLYSVGDVVTYRLIEKGIIPDIAVIDGHTMRSPCDRSPLIQARRFHVKNPAGTLSGELLEGLLEAVTHMPALVCVDGEEDLAVIPLVIMAPMGAIVLYGQPGEGVVLRTVDAGAKEKANEMFRYFEDRS